MLEKSQQRTRECPAFVSVHVDAYAWTSQSYYTMWELLCELLQECVRWDNFSDRVYKGTVYNRAVLQVIHKIV